MRDLPLNLKRILARRGVRVALGGLALLLLPFLLDLLFPFPWAALDRPPALIVEDRAGEPLRFFLPADDHWRFPVRLSELPPELPKALVASEDRRFWSHPGVDLLAIFRAAGANLKAGEVVSGASTIPMQIARMSSPRRRTLWAKMIEAARAIQLTAHVSKRRQLELYLNLTPYGGNLEGVGAASWFYFGKSASQLSLGEISLLTALPRSPSRYDPTTHPIEARQARDRVLRQLAERGAFTQREIAEGFRQPLPAKKRRAPFFAPQFAERIARLSPGRVRVKTSIDSSVQRTAEELVKRRIAELRALGIGNASAVVIEMDEPRESGRRSLRALVGSAGYDETAFQGQVDGSAARRSPGSTLKPFLYAMAFDDGRVLPESYLLDIPTDFGGYVAENYDDVYRGRSTVRDALIHSLNACAVRLLSEVGLERFHKRLLAGGLSTLDRPTATYGLPLILGAGEVTLLDLVNLYATLGQGGLHRPVEMIVPEESARRARGTEPPPARLFSAEASALTTEILTDLKRPDLPESWQLAMGVPAVAWKTGTSYGHRDAWAVGFSGRYAIGVWVGNFDGTPHQGISGSEHAGPLLFDLFRAIDRGGSGPKIPRDLRIEPIELCAVSRQLPTPDCPSRIQTVYLPGKTKLTACSVHRRAFVDAKTGDLLGGDCLNRPYRSVVLEFFPPELVAWWQAQGMSVPAIPQPSPDCASLPGREPPKIVSPDPFTPYRMRRDAPASDQRIPLIARVGVGASRVWWYQNGVLVASGKPGESLFLEAVPGEHRLVVTDDLGRSDGVGYKVE